MTHKIIIFAIAAIFSISATQMQAQDKDKTVKEIKSKEVIKTRNINPHIENTVPLSDENTKPAPMKKGGEASQVAEYEVIVDNFTGYFIEVYIDGTYKGTISDWGTITITMDKAYEKLYCITTGGTKDWLVTGSFSEDLVWKLMK